MVSYFLGLTVQLSSAPAKYKMKCRAPHTWQAGVAAVAANRASEAQVHSERRRKGHRVELAAGGHSLLIHLTDRAEWFASQMLREAVEIQSQQKKKKDKQPGELLSGQMDSRVTGHQISHTVPHKAAGWH